MPVMQQGSQQGAAHEVNSVSPERIHEQGEEAQASGGGGSASSTSRLNTTDTRVSANCYKIILGQVLLGPKATPVHESHDLWFWAGLYYCQNCGAFGNHRSVLLGSPCKRHPSKAGAAALKRLRRGQAPSPSIQVTGDVTKKHQKVVRALPSAS